MSTTPRISLDVRQATPDDLGAVLELLHGAYEWLIAQSITDQWTRPFPSESIAASIEHGEVYVTRGEGAGIGTFTLGYRPDAELWGEPPEDAGYVGRL